MVGIAENLIAELPRLEYKPLSGDPRGAFSCGEPGIDRWFKQCLSKHSKFSNRVTTAHFEGEKEIVGFYALSMKLEIERMLTTAEIASWRTLFNSNNKTFICLNFDYLAVSQRHQRRGIGTIIMGKVIADFANIASACGVEIMTGSAINVKRYEFYKRLGFQKYGYAEHQPQIFLPAQSAIEIVGA